MVALALTRASSLLKWRLLAGMGSARDALRHLAGGDGRQALADGEETLRRCERLGVAVLTAGEPGYPDILTTIPDPPLALYLRGRLTAADEAAIAIVGSRRCSPYGLQMAERLATDLARRGATIVSGLARGIDAAAHRAALAASGRTLAVLGSGMDRLYPREHARLADRIVENGAVISEHALGEPPLPEHFPRRNRIISGLSLGVVVVEASRASGSLITARLAGEQGREVFAVPGPVGSETSEGTHGLIQAGAKLVTGVADIIEELRPGVRERLAGPENGPSGDPSHPFTEDERALLAALPPTGALDPDRLTEKLPRWGIHRVLATLGGLELRGEVRSHPGGRFSRASPGGRGATR
jgi:DNA processing protein